MPHLGSLAKRGGAPGQARRAHEKVMANIRNILILISDEHSKKVLGCYGHVSMTLVVK
jgi:hypothetical protein